MKFFVAALAAVVQISNVAAFPAVAEDLANRAAQKIPNQQAGGFQEPIPNFDGEKQRVSIEGKHRFIPPNYEAGDARGPCPGLNAMANHGYLPRNGVGSHLDFIKGTFDVFGMSADLSGFLTVLGAVVDGDGLKWSIGGPSKYVPGLPPLLGVPQGISGSHNRYEADVSPGRGDLYQNGDDFLLRMEHFKKLYDLGQKRGDLYSLKTLIDHRVTRFQESISQNPYFFNGPFTGVLVQPAAYSFIYRFMSNKSEEYPLGILRGDVLMSFFGVTKDRSGKLHKKDGHERIPYNWYKRAVGNEYSIALLNLDTSITAKDHPQFLSVGGNTGKVNTFTGVAIEDLSGGAFNAQDLLKGNNLACFAMQFAVQVAPDQLRCSSILGNITSQVTKLTSQFAQSTKGLGCRRLGKPNDKQFQKFPGYSKLNCKTGTYTT